MWRYWLHVRVLSDTSGNFFGGDQRAAAAFGLSRRAILAYRKRLVDLGLLLPGRFPREDGRPTVYKVAAWHPVEQRRKPFLHLPRSMIYALDLSACELRLLVEYLRHPDWDQTDKALAAVCKMSPRQVRYSRTRLRELGYLWRFVCAPGGGVEPGSPHKGKVDGHTAFRPAPLVVDDVYGEAEGGLRVVS
jgi:hypothetical protein